MRLANYCFFIFIFFLIVNCKKEEIPIEIVSSEEMYFSYQLGNQYTIEDSWLIIHDMEGNLLDYKPFVNRVFLDFSAPKGTIPELLTITLLSVRYESSGVSSHYIRTYTDIKKGSSWNNNTNTNSLRFSGAFNVKVKNVPEVNGVSVFTTDGRLRQIDYTINTESDGSLTLDLPSVSLAKNKEYLISISDYDGNLRYTKLTPTNNFDQLVDYVNFLDYDSYLEMELPLNHTFSTQGATENTNYYSEAGFGKNGISYSENNIVNNIAKVGYLDSFEKFKTVLVASIEDYDYGYIFTGGKMDIISLPIKPSIEIINESGTNFKFSSNSNFVREYSSWTSDKKISNGETGFTYLHVNSTGENGHKLGPFPDEILEKYPSLTTNNLELILLKLFTKSNSYEEFIETTKKTYEDKRDGVTEYFLLKYFLN